MPLKIVRNDIAKMEVDAVINTANADVAVGKGCDTAIYNAAGFDRLFSLRKAIGKKKEGDVFLTPGFDLPAKYIIHTVSPFYSDGNSGEEKILRKCYQNALKLAYKNGFSSVAFPLIATGSYGYPKASGIRIAAEEISAFLLRYEMLVYLVLFDSESTDYGKSLYPDLESYIDDNFVGELTEAEYSVCHQEVPELLPRSSFSETAPPVLACRGSGRRRAEKRGTSEPGVNVSQLFREEVCAFDDNSLPDFDELHYGHTEKIRERLKHLSDDYVDYLLYLIKEKGLTPSEVYKNAAVDKKLFSKIKNKKDPHPGKMILMQLCIGAKLSLDESVDLLARAGYAFSPCSITDVIFKYFIENGYYDIYDLDIELENHDVPCIIKV